MASLVAAVAVVVMIGGCVGPHQVRTRTNVTPIAMDAGQPGGFIRGGKTRVKSIVEGTVGELILNSPANVTVTLKGYASDVGLQDDETNFQVFVPTSTSDKFASGTSGGHTLFDGDESGISLTANTNRTIYFKIQNISARTQFTIISLNSAGTYGGAYTVVAIPE